MKKCPLGCRQDDVSREGETFTETLIRTGKSVAAASDMNESNQRQVVAECGPDQIEDDQQPAF